MRVGFLACVLFVFTAHCADEQNEPIDVSVSDILPVDVQADATPSCDNAPNGAVCDDGDPCSLGDTCQGGVCVGGTNKTCDSENPCKVGVCEPSTGDCQYTELPNGSPCSLACFEGSTCQDGGCAVDPTTEVDCSDELEAAQITNPCLEDLRCGPTSGQCDEEVFLPSGTSCDTDSNLCTLEYCSQDGVCEDLDEVVSCANEVAVNPCATYACDPKTGDCKGTGFAGPISCDDKNACTTEDTCSEDEFGFFLCKGSPVAVDDNNPCTDDQCKQGTVTHTPIPGLPCDAKTNCSDVWLCSVAGKCEPGAPNSTCAKGLVCTAPYCDAVSGGCVENIDKDYCILNDECVPDGQVHPENPCLVCDASATQINWSSVQEGTECSDGDACTKGDVCDGKGTCSPGDPVDCQNTVCTTSACDSQTGGCVVVEVSQGYCLIDGSCVSENAAQGDNVCVTCQPNANQEGWTPVSKDALAPCGDGKPCNGEELCDGTGQCAPGEPVDCDDGNECTLDTCSPNTGQCAHTPEPDCPVLIAPITDKNLNGIWGDENGTLWVVGDDGTVLKGNEDGWFVVQVPVCMSSRDLLAVDGFAGGDIWIGANEESLMRFDGTSFHCADENGNAYLVQPGPNDNRVHKVWAAPPENIVAFRYIKEVAGYLLHIFQYTDGSWKNLAMAAGFNASGIQARPVVPCATNDVFLSTFPNANLGQTNAKIQRFKGQASLTLLNPIQDPADPVREMRDGVCLSPTDVHMAGHVGQVAHWNGVSLSHTNLYVDVEEELRPTFWGMAGNTQNGLVVVGDGGAIARFADGAWTELVQATEATLNDVWVAPDGTGWAVGDNGTILRIDAPGP